VNVPGFMTWIFWIFKPILPAATVKKMSVVGSGPSTIGAALLPVIDAEELPSRYGGKASPGF
jgi:phosphatidylinositol transfer protein SFH5